MPPIVILCLQLIIGTVCSNASPAHIRPAVVAGPAVLFPSSGGPSSLSSSSGHRTSSSNINTSKRQPMTLIESGDGFAYRQHHQPPAGGQQKHHQPPDEGYFYGQHHFRQPQAYPPPDQHLYQPGPMSPPMYHPRGGSGAEGFMSEALLPESQDYYQQRGAADGFDLAFPEVPPSSSASAEMENEIDGNPAALLFAADDDSKKPSSGSGGSSSNNNNNNHNGNGGGGAGESFDLIRESLERIKEEEDIDIKSELLMRLLEQMPEGPLPVVYIEDSAGKSAIDDSASDDAGIVVEGTEDQLTGNGNKRSGRYYRRYPWKRQNSRSRTYDADARYLCVPSRDDIFKLLVGLHENRTGNHQRTINFCNRKRPAKAIFTNIRFLG